ncbi:MAG: hypothetical protein Q9186_005766, partial [Xanthomendoza sp. 1 TL-2023]
TEYTYFTAPPPSPTSINNLSDAETSTSVSLPLLTSSSDYDANLIACFSPHPLVSALSENGIKVPTIGIFEAAVKVSLIFLSSSSGIPGKKGEGEGKGEGDGEGEERKKFGIISTGHQWQEILTEAVVEDMGVGKQMFAGVETVGVDAGGLHSAPGASCAGDAGSGGGGDGEGEGAGETVQEKVKAATGRLVGRGDVGVVVLGCAGMVGMEEWVREVVGEGVRVVDGVKAGVGLLQGLVRGGF